MKSTHVISIRLSFSMHPPSDGIDDQKLQVLPM